MDIQDFKKSINKAMNSIEDVIDAIDEDQLAGDPNDIYYVWQFLIGAHGYLDDAYEGLKDLHNASDKDYEGVGY